MIWFLDKLNVTSLV